MKTERILAAMPLNEASRTFLTDEVRAKLESLGPVTWQTSDVPLDADELIRLLPGHSAMLTTWGQKQLTQEILDAAPELRFIAHTAGTVASFCGPEVYGRGIRVVSGNDIFAESVAEASLAYIFASLREIPHYDRLMKEGGWREGFYNEGLFGRTVALAGFGTIPRFLIPMLAPFRCPVMAYDPLVSAEEMASYGVQKASLEYCFKNADIVSLHLPLKEDTVGMIDTQLLGSMKPGALLVNTSRGAVLDETALAQALNEGRIRAVLDVFAREPLAADSPLRSTPNTILIPHMAGPTLDRRPAAALSVIEDMERFFRGEELLHEIKAAKAAQMTR